MSGFGPAGAIIANRFIDEASKKSTDASSKIAAGKAFTRASQDAAGAAIDSKLGADQAGLRQAGKNAKQGVALIQTADGAYASIIKELTRMKELATQIQNGAIQEDERAQANAEFQQRLNQITDISNTTRFGNTALLQGGGGTLNLHTPTAATAIANEVIDNELVYNTDQFLGTLNTTLTMGYVSGNISNIQVEDFDGTQRKVTMQIGEQTFTGLVTAADAPATVTLVSTSSLANQVAFNFGANGNLINTTALLNTALNYSLGNANIVSASADASAANTYTTSSFATTSNTAAGAYALSYVASSQTFKLYEASTGITHEATPSSIVAATATNVTFGNGLSFQMAAGWAATAATTNLAQITFHVEKGTSVSMNFQTNVKGTDISTVNFVATTLTDLGLSGSKIDTVTDAVSALTSIDTAINTINVARANIGALQSRFESIIDNNAIQSENLGVIRESFSGLDYATTQTELTQAEVQMQAAIAIASKKNEEMKSVLALIK